jgi:putative ABC transport system permease protein
VLRSFRNHPSVSVVAIVSIALAIGATTTVFSVVKAILIEPLPFADPARLVTVFEYDPATPDTWRTTSQGSFSDLRRSGRSFERVVAGRNRSFTLSSFEDGDTPLMREISFGYFELLGVAPQLGRTFVEEEDGPGGAKVVILSHELWQRRYGGARDVIGRSTELDGVPHEIVGVMPAHYQNPVWGLDVPPQAWRPLALPETGLERRGNAHLVFARLAPDVCIEEAQQEMNGLALSAREAYPDEYQNVEFLVTPAKERIVRGVRPMLIVLLAAVAFVLLVACGNVANLLLTRAVERRRELAVRRALGAGVPQILRQLLTESVVLAGVGGVLGVLVAIWGVSSVGNLIPSAPGSPGFSFVVDVEVLLFTLVLSVATALLFGAAPVYHVLRDSAESDLSVGALRATADRSRQRLRGGLVVLEVALSMMLLVGAGLMLTSFANLRALDPGFDADSLLTFRVSTRGPDYREGAARAAFFEHVVDEVARIPGVVAVGSAQFNPMFSQFLMQPVRIGGQPSSDPGSEPRVAVALVIPGFLETLGVPLLAGRGLERRDGASTTDVVVINRTMAGRLFEGRNPLGERITIIDERDGGISREVVGVVGDVRSAQVPPLPQPIAYVPLAQDPNATSALFVVRTNGDPRTFLTAVETSVRRVDRSMPVYQVQTMRQVIESFDVTSRFLSVLLGVFAILGLALAVSGIYGVLAYAVTQRTREIGIRVALGAQRAEVVRIILRGAVVLGAAGTATGALGALVLSRALQSQLFGVSAMDPRLYAALAALLLGVVVASASVPALRAMAVDPIVALREE